MKIDISKLVDEVDRCLFKRIDLTEAQVKTLSKLCVTASVIYTTYMLLSIHHQRKETAKLDKLVRDIEDLKNAKGD